MSLSRLYSGLVSGVAGHVVTVETHLDQGLPGVHIVGLPDQAVRESRDRIRPALKESGFDFPNRKITVNLSPADRAKQGSTYDLPIALGILRASGQLEIPSSVFGDWMIVGEITLDGSLRGIHGALPIALEARGQGFSRMMVPAENYHEADPTGIDVVGVSHLREAVAAVENRLQPTTPPTPSPGGTNRDPPDFGDVRGQRTAKRALCVSAAGEHNALMVGPPGTGKSMLARRVPGILPPLDKQQSLETTSVHSVAGQLVGRGHLISLPPFRAPHHTISGAGLVGGGQVPKPGEASLAHNGVLFMDELPEFDRSILETLRQPLESNFVNVSRAKATHSFPADFLLVGAMNPCPCGYLTHPDRQCICRPAQIDRYHQKLSGPLLDRIDLHLSVGPVDFDSLRGTDGEEVLTTRDLRARVLEARDRQRHRYREETFKCNGDLPAKKVETYCVLTGSAEDLLREVVDDMGYSARSVHRLQKVARTLADFEQCEKITDDQMAEALQFRNFTEDPWRT